MKFKTTIILLIVAIIGVAYIFLYERRQFRTEEWVQRQQMVLPDYKPGAINKIEIKKGESSIVLETADDVRWRMLEPLQLRADKAEVINILSQFEFLRKIGTIKENETEKFNLKEFGLDSPEIVVNLWMKKSSTVKEVAKETVGMESKYTINIGDRLAAGQDNVYIRVEGDRDVFVVPGKFLEKIDKDINDLRNKWAFEFDEAAIERLKLQSGSGKPIVCAKQEQLWWISQPISDRGDTERIKDILSELKNIKIAKADFVSDREEDVTRFGLDKPRLSISVGSTGDVQSLCLGHSLDDRIYAKLDGESSIFFLHDVVLRDLDLEPNDLRDKQFLRFESIGTYGIEKIELKYPDSTLTLEKTKQYDWVVKSPSAILADRDTVREFVEKIKDLQIQMYVDDSGKNFDKYGFGDSPVEVSVFRRIGEGETVKFMIGKTDEDGGLCYVRRDGEDAVYAVPTENFYELAQAGFLAFRDKLVLEFPKENAQELVINRDDETFICRKKEDNHVSKWYLDSPVKMVADTDAVNQVVWNLSFLMADKIVTLSASDPGIYGFDNPVLKVAITYEVSAPAEKGDVEVSTKEDLVKPKERITRIVLVGNRLEPENDKSNYYAKLDGEDMIFQIGWTDVRDYSVELVTMQLFDMSSATSNSLKIKHPERELSFRKNEENYWEMIAPANKVLKGNFANRIIDGMTLLKADKIVRYSNKDLSRYELDNPHFSISVGTEEGEKLLQVGKKDGSRYFVMSNTTNFVYLINGNKINDIIEACLKTDIQ